MSRYKLQAWLNQWEQVVRAAKRKYRGSKKELAVIQEMHQRLHVVSGAVADDEFEGAVFSAVQFGLWAGEWDKLIKVKKHLTGQESKAKAQAERKEYFRIRFVIHQPGSKNKKEACQKADKDTNNKFPDMDPYKSGSWYAVVKGL